MTVIFQAGLNEPPANWVELTEADVTNITFQNLGTASMFVQATTGAMPTTTAGSIEYPGAAKETNVLLADLFPGVAGADRLWAYALTQTTAFVSHATGVNKTVTLAPSQDYTKARIAHSLNWLSGGDVIAFDGSALLLETGDGLLLEDDSAVLLESANNTAAGYYADGPNNSLTYETWQPSAVPATWEYDHGSSATVDYCAIAAHTLGTSGSTIKVQYWTGSAWADVIPSSAITDDSPIFCLFEGVSAQRWRLNITASTTPPTIGAVKFGQALQMQQAIYGGHSPVNLARQTILRSNLSETGEFLGRTKQRALLSTSYSWTHLKADWIRTNWPTLQKAIEAEPFWIAWRPADYGEVGYAQTDAVPIPQNMGIKDFMQVELSIRARAWD